MNPPLEPWNDPTLEARVVACVLGEASAFERAEIDRLLSESPELAAFARRIRAVHGLLGEATRGGAEDIWKMEPERRGKLLLGLGAPMPASQAMAMPARKKRRFDSRNLLYVACMVFGLVVFSSLFFSASSGRPGYSAKVTKSEAPRESDEQMVALAKETPADLFRSTTKDVSGALAANEAGPQSAAHYSRLAETGSSSGETIRFGLGQTEDRSEVAASPPGAPSSPAVAFAQPLPEPAPPPAPLVADNSGSINVAGELKPQQVAIATKHLEIRQKNNEELDYDLTVADENRKARSGQDTWFGTSDLAEGKDKDAESAFKKTGSGSVELSDGNSNGGGTVARNGSLSFEGFTNMGEPINGVTNGRRSGDAPVSRGQIDSILSGKNEKPGELSLREDVAKVEVVRELKPGDVGVVSEIEPQSMNQSGGIAAGTFFPATPPTPTDFEERVDSFGNTMVFPTEYDPPELPNSVGGAVRENVSRFDLAASAQMGEVPVVGRLFQDRLEETAPSADAPAGGGGELAGKLEIEGEKGEKKSGADVDPFASGPDDSAGDPFSSLQEEAAADPFAAEPEKPKSQEKSPAPEQQQAAPTMENKLTDAEPVSTFSLNVSDASFQLGARALLGGAPVPPESVRAEDYVNAMDYGDAMPARGEAVSAVIQQSGQPFVPGRNLVRIGVRTAADGRAQGQPLSLVLLVDQSGSMERPDRVEAMERALGELAGLLGKDDTLTVIGFAREPHLLADRISGDQAAKVPALIRNSPPQGGTNLEAAFDLASEVATRQAKPGAQNRVVLFTDGAANLGQIDPEALGARVEALRRQRIAFDACGVGTADLADNVLEAMTRRGDGRYLVLDAEGENSVAKQLAGAFRPAARNVKVQVRFNPERVEAYQLFGFEKHLLNEEDFRDDSVDAAELAAAEQGNALYQVRMRADGHGDIGDVAVRFQDTTTGRMVERNWTIPYDPSTPALDQAAPSMQLAAAAGLLAESLRGSPIGQSVDPASLVNVQVKLRSAFPGDSRVATLLAMWEQVRQRR
ncbi:MAG: von Willebrand factor type A domain-containing protein [Verrucomicrobiales bacterium]